jgi:ankyrin repeat protein
MKKLLCMLCLCQFIFSACETTGRRLNDLDRAFLDRVKRGRYSEAEAFLKQGVNIRVTDHHGENVVFYALENGDIETAERYMKRGVPFQNSIRTSVAEYHVLLRYAQGGTPDAHGLLPGLDYALKRFGDPKALVSRKFRSVTGEELTLVMEAARFGSESALRTLLQYKPDLSVTSSLGRTALDMAYFRQKLEAANILIKHKAPMTKNWTLVNAIIYRNEAVAAEALRDGADPDTPVDTHGLTPLVLSIQNGTAPITRLLLEKGANPRKHKDHYYPPIHYAARRNDVPVLRMLTAHGADVNEEAENGTHAVHLAKLRGSKEAIAFLESAGAMTVAQVEQLYEKRRQAVAAREDFAEGLLKILSVTARGIHGFNKGYYESKGYKYDIPD